MRITTSVDPLPADWHGTPQELLQAFVDRLNVTTDSREFVPDGNVPPNERDEPITDGRPWFKNGTELWVWNGSAYVAASTEEAVLPQVKIGPDEPDPAEYGLWLETLDNTVQSFKVYLGSTAGWVEQVFELEDLSVTSEKFADAAVTTEKLDNLSVTAAKLAGDIPTTKWELGGAGYYLRMNAAGTVPEWSLVTETVDVAITLGALTEYVHNKPNTPFFVDAYLVNVETEHGWVKDDAIRWTLCYGPFYRVATSSTQIGPVGLWKSPTRVFCWVPTTVYVPLKSALDTPPSTYAITPTKWKLQFKITHA